MTKSIKYSEAMKSRWASKTAEQKSAIMRKRALKRWKNTPLAKRKAQSLIMEKARLKKLSTKKNENSVNT